MRLNVVLEYLHTVCLVHKAMIGLVNTVYDNMHAVKVYQTVHYVTNQHETDIGVYVGIRLRLAGFQLVTGS